MDLKLRKGIHHLVNANAKGKTIEGKSFLEWFLDAKKSFPKIGLVELERIAYHLDQVN